MITLSRGGSCISGLWDIYGGQMNQIFFRRSGGCVLQTKEEKNHPEFFQKQGLKSDSVMVRGRISIIGQDDSVRKHNDLGHFCS